MTKDAPPTDPQWIATASDRHAIADGCWFDPDAAERPIEFMRRFLRITHPRHANQTIAFDPFEWQADIIRRIFGWLRPDGTRRFRRAWVEVAKKNGKSPLAAAILIYMLVADGEPDPQCFGAATTRDQAKVVFREAQKMVERSPALKKILEVRQHVSRITYPKAMGFYAAIANQPSANDGINAHAIIIDEMHRMKSRELYDVLTYATAARPQPLEFIITTAGDSRETIGYELHERAEKIIAGSVIDTETFVYIAAADQDDDAGDPETWHKANPSLGLTIRESELAAEYERAKDSPARLQNFRRLRLNQWTSAISRWLDYDRWEACPARPEPEELQGQTAYAGLDLSSKYDLTALVLQLPTTDADGRTMHDVLPFFFLPEQNIADAEHKAGVPYRAWAEQGLIELTPGDYIDHSYIRRRANELREQYTIAEIAFDPAYAQQIAIDLQDDGFTVFEFWQRRTMTNPVLRYLENCVIEARLRHGNHPILNWNAGNVEIDENVDGLIKAVKPKNAAKIDGITALAMALGNSTKKAEAETFYETSPLAIV
ncbi:MAG: terminase TerL endonuclease subunit [Planctomycetota bacterium]